VSYGKLDTEQMTKPTCLKTQAGALSGHHPFLGVTVLWQFSYLSQCKVPDALHVHTTFLNWNTLHKIG